MRSRLMTITGVFLGGIAVAALFVFVGCIGEKPPLAAYCGHDPFGPAILVAIMSWLVLGTIAVGVRALRNNE